MKKTCLFLLSAVCVFSCSNHDSNFEAENNEQLIKENAIKVFGDIDPNHDWNMVKSGTVSITADADLNDIVKVQILTESPFCNDDAAILNQATVQKGQTVSLVYDAPTACEQLFAACVSSKGEYFIKVFKPGESAVNFGTQAAARTNRAGGETYPSASSIVLGAPTKSYNALRAEASNAAADHKIQVIDQVSGGVYRNYDVWYHSSWENERMWSVSSLSDEDWTFENGTISKPVSDNVDITTVKEIVNGFLRKTGAIHTTNNKSNNWETIVTSTPYFVLNKNYLIATGEPVTITPIQMNTTEGMYNAVYYYYFNPAVTAGMTAEQEANYIKALPKFKAVNGFSSDKFNRAKQYLLPYYGDGAITEGATAQSISIPAGYKIGFLNQKNLKESEGIKYCANGCTYGDGRLNTEVNHLIGHYFSAIDKTISQTSEKILSNGSIDTQTKYGLTEEGMKWNSPRIAVFGANNHVYMCFEDGADCTFGDMVIEVNNGAKLENEEFKLFGEAYTMCIEDRLEYADYDMNDVVLQAVRLNETQVQLSLIATGAFDRLWIKGLNGSVLTTKEVHELFGFDKSEVFVNTEGQNGSVHKDPITDVLSIGKTQTISDFLKKISVFNETTHKTISVPTKAGEPPYAIIVPIKFRYPLETLPITKAYPDFSYWAKDATKPGNWYVNCKEDMVYNK